MGTPEFAVFSLRAFLKSDYQVIRVITQPDRARGRGRKVVFSPVKNMAISHKLPVWQPERINDDLFVSRIKALLPDIIVVVAYGQILTGTILNLPKFGCINLHASLLPRYRGSSPINWAIIKGEEMTGITTILMDEGMDTGDILLQQEVAIKNGENALELYQRLAEEGARLLMETLSGVERDNINPTPQGRVGVSYAPRLKKEDGLVNWARPGKEILNLIRGLNPSPVAYTHLEGERLKIYDSLIVNEDKGINKPGQICDISDNGIKVACSDVYLYLTEVQLENRKRMPVEKFLRGTKIRVGTILQ